MTDIKGPTYSVPRFDDWQATSEWRIQLEADVYVENYPVGRDVFLTGRVSWRTVPGRPDSQGWQYGGSHLYRTTPEGGVLEASGLDPTSKMIATVRDGIELEPPSDALRLTAVRETIARRQQQADYEYEKAQRDTLELSEKFATALVVDLPELFTKAGVV